MLFFEIGGVMRWLLGWLLGTVAYVSGEGEDLLVTYSVFPKRRRKYCAGGVHFYSRVRRGDVKCVCGLREVEFR